MVARRLLLFDLDGVLLETGELRRSAAAAEALALLRHEGDAVLSLVTGEDEGEARRKTDVVGVNRYLDLDVGVYGSDSENWSEQVSLARRKARESYGCEFEVMVVTAGSTTDVANARRTADLVFAVSSTEAAGLRAAGADHVVTDLLGVVELTGKNSALTMTQES